jgi:hypothetical protein
MFLFLFLFYFYFYCTHLGCQTNTTGNTSDHVRTMRTWVTTFEWHTNYLIPGEPPYGYAKKGASALEPYVIKKEAQEEEEA